MYELEHFKVEDSAALGEIIRAHPLGLLITAGASGLIANSVPFILKQEGDGVPRLHAHLARANGQWRDIARGCEALAVFQGANFYVTPSWYETKKATGKVVPTWNYVVVQAR